MLSLVLSKGVQLRANSAHRIYVYSLYYCMLKQVMEVTFPKHLTPREHTWRCEPRMSRVACRYLLQICTPYGPINF